MKKLIVTRADERIRWMINLCHPGMQKYANMCGADFKVLNEVVDDNHPHYRILQVYDIYEDYDRILLMDTDIFIKKNCPDLFEMIPEDMVGSVLEDAGSREAARRQTIQDIQKKKGYIGWEKGYVNSGIFMTSKCHREIFKFDKENLWTGFGEDDPEFGYLINKLGFKVFELDYKFNHMSMYSESWNGSPSKFDSFIIHYAGNGFRPANKQTEMEEDYILLNRYGEILCQN